MAKPSRSKSRFAASLSDVASKFTVPTLRPREDLLNQPCANPAAPMRRRHPHGDQMGQGRVLLIDKRGNDAAGNAVLFGELRNRPASDQRAARSVTGSMVITAQCQLHRRAVNPAPMGA
jgi:hypothetical protein